MDVLCNLCHVVLLLSNVNFFILITFVSSLSYQFT